MEKQDTPLACVCRHIRRPARLKEDSGETESVKFNIDHLKCIVKMGTGKAERDDDLEGCKLELLTY